MSSFVAALMPTKLKAFEVGLTMKINNLIQ